MSDSGYLIDTSVWIALAFTTHPRHRKAVDAFALCSVDRPAIFCRAAQQSFLRLITTPAILQVYNAVTLSNRDALIALNRFMRLPSVGYRDEPAGIVPMWHGLAIRDSTSPKVWMDAFLAAFAICGGHQLVTRDRGFRQFKGLDLAILSQP